MVNWWIVVLGSALVASNGYLLMVRPARSRQVLRTAVELLRSDARRDMEQAEERLTEVLAGGLGRRDVPAARFALALVRAKLGRGDRAKLTEALATLGSPESARRRHPQSAHLYLWIQAELGNHDAVLELGDPGGWPGPARGQSAEIYHAALLRKAAEHWSRREFDGALHYLERVPRAGRMSDVTLPELVEVELEHGMRAITDGRLEVAHEAFTNAAQRAGQSTVARQEADLGLLLCRWRQGDRADLVTELASAMDALARRGAARGVDGDDVTQLRAHVAWWYLVALMERWKVKVPAGSLPPNAEYEHFLSAVRIGELADPELGDLAMIHGMVELGLAAEHDHERRTRAVVLLRQAVRRPKGVCLREVNDLITSGSAADPGTGIDGLAARLAASPAVASWARYDFSVLPGSTVDWEMPLPPDGTQQLAPSAAVMVAFARLTASQSESGGSLASPMAEFEAAEEELASAERELTRVRHRAAQARLELISRTSRLLLDEEGEI
jgi:hypothetical protein